ncbi:MAG: hypothetical protein HY347_01725 [candidate division NC10 bacterium]|nr:hypothetical protein [candidate division NC10 bacterium]
MNVRGQIRRTLLEIARRRQRPGSGSGLKLLTRRTVQVQWPDLTPVLRPIPWAVIGAAATRLYMPERTTRDLDIVVRAEDGPQVRQKLAAAGFQYQGELSVRGSSWLSPDGCFVDVLEWGEPWCAQAIAQAEQNRDAQGLPVLPFHFLVLMKFQAGRVQDLADITRMLGQADEEKLAVVRALFAERAPEDLEDLQSLIILGKLEMQLPSARGGEAQLG